MEFTKVNPKNYNATKAKYKIMIKHILDLLALDEFYGQSELIEIAKGKYQRPTTLKQGFNQIKREIKWLKRKQ